MFNPAGCRCCIGVYDTSRLRRPCQAIQRGGGSAAQRSGDERLWWTPRAAISQANMPVSQRSVNRIPQRVSIDRAGPPCLRRGVALGSCYEHCEHASIRRRRGQGETAIVYSSRRRYCVSIPPRSRTSGLDGTPSSQTSRERQRLASNRGTLRPHAEPPPPPCRTRKVCLSSCSSPVGCPLIRVSAVQAHGRASAALVTGWPFASRCVSVRAEGLDSRPLASHRRTARPDVKAPRSRLRRYVSFLCGPPDTKLTRFCRPARMQATNRTAVFYGRPSARRFAHKARAVHGVSASVQRCLTVHRSTVFRGSRVASCECSHVGSHNAGRGAANVVLESMQERSGRGATSESEYLLFYSARFRVVPDESGGHSRAQPHRECTTQATPPRTSRSSPRAVGAYSAEG